MSSYSNILYIFGSGRKEKILEDKLDSSEFFYGYFHMKSKFKDIDSGFKIWISSKDSNQNKEKFIDELIALAKKNLSIEKFNQIRDKSLAYIKNDIKVETKKPLTAIEINFGFKLFFFWVIKN